LLTGTGNTIYQEASLGGGGTIDIGVELTHDLNTPGNWAMFGTPFTPANCPPSSTPPPISASLLDFNKSAVTYGKEIGVAE